ncbi:unnamed protein product, partial [Ceratitis capitata]
MVRKKKENERAVLTPSSRPLPYLRKLKDSGRTIKTKRNQSRAVNYSAISFWFASHCALSSSHFILFNWFQKEKLLEANFRLVNHLKKSTLLPIGFVLLPFSVLEELLKAAFVVVGFYRSENRNT